MHLCGRKYLANKSSHSKQTVMFRIISLKLLELFHTQTISAVKWHFTSHKLSAAILGGNFFGGIIFVVYCGPRGSVISIESGLIERKLSCEWACYFSRSDLCCFSNNQDALRQVATWLHDPVKTSGSRRGSQRSHRQFQGYRRHTARLWTGSYCLPFELDLFSWTVMATVVFTNQ